MSFGFSVGDFVTLSALAFKVVQNARQACGAHDALTREVSSLHIVLRRLEDEVSNPSSVINRENEQRRQELESIMAGCNRLVRTLDQVLSKYAGLSEERRRLTRLRLKVKFGNGEMKDLGQIRTELSTYTSAITLYLNLLSMKSQGRVEEHMDKHSAELRKLRQSINWATATLQAKNGNSEGSILSSYAGDDKAIWKEFRRELIKEGFSSSMLNQHKRVIKDYVMELGSCGALDDPVSESPQPRTQPTVEDNEDARQGSSSFLRQPPGVTQGYSPSNSASPENSDKDEFFIYEGNACLVPGRWSNTKIESDRQHVNSMPRQQHSDFAEQYIQRRRALNESDHQRINSMPRQQHSDFATQYIQRCRALDESEHQRINSMPRQPPDLARQSSQPHQASFEDLAEDVYGTVNSMPSRQTNTKVESNYQYVKTVPRQHSPGGHGLPSESNRASDEDGGNVVYAYDGGNNYLMPKIPRTTIAESDYVYHVPSDVEDNQSTASSTSSLSSAQYGSEVKPFKPATVEEVEDEDFKPGAHPNCDNIPSASINKASSTTAQRKRQSAGWDSIGAESPPDLPHEWPSTQSIPLTLLSIDNLKQHDIRCEEQLKAEWKLKFPADWEMMWYIRKRREILQRSSKGSFSTVNLMNRLLWEKIHQRSHRKETRWGKEPENEVIDVFLPDK